jgi:hypothetical protein
MFIEDNAHGFGGTFDGQMLGTFGDVGVSGLRKSFPVINGAYLYTQKGTDLDLSALQRQPCGFSWVGILMKRWIRQIPVIDTAMKRRRRMIEYRKRMGPPPPYGSQQAYREPRLTDDYGMAKSTESFVMGQDIEYIRKIRRKIYHIWKQWTGSQGLTPVFPHLSPGAIPLVYPAFTESPLNSLKWYERGHRGGVDIHSWPTLPQAIVKRDSGAMRIWERMLCFPIHQEMNERLLERRLAVI